MIDVILVLNAGSSSIKFRVFDAAPVEPQLVLVGRAEGLNSAPRFQCRDHEGRTIAEESWESSKGLSHHEAIKRIAEFLRAQGAGYRLRAVGHRVVHGGTQFTEPMPVSAALIQELEKLSPLAPLHQPHNLAAIKALSTLRPELPQVACFDTGFHRSQPELAQIYALPAAITARGVRRYGFHGLSYEYMAGVLPAALPGDGKGRTVVAHLGNGASMCAIRDGKSMASTMGFTAVDGLPMGTRSGSLDPGVILYLMDELKMDTRAIETMIYKESGLLGVSGISSDMRTLIASDTAQARLAVSLFIYRIGRELGSLAAAMQGIDALVFTAGVGEHSAFIRERVCRDAAWLGLELDANANQRGGTCISTRGSKVSAWVIPTDEELIIARHTRRLIGAQDQA
jgi:acetate kinase